MTFKWHSKGSIVFLWKIATTFHILWPKWLLMVEAKLEMYHNDPKFSDRYAWANSADPDQTAPRGAVWSGSTLFAIPSASFGLITLW